MTEVDYEYECSRAELLGLPKPNREEFLSSHKTSVKDNEEAEEMTVEQAEDADAKREGFKRIGGGLDELNSILTSTQKKLNRFKTVCGSFSNLLKLQIGARKEEENDKSNIEANEEGSEGVKEPDSTSSSAVKKDDAQLSLLDSLIGKAERAELSLSSQNKQMKKFLN